MTICRLELVHNNSFKIVKISENNIKFKHIPSRIIEIIEFKKDQILSHKFFNIIANLNPSSSAYVAVIVFEKLKNVLCKNELLHFNENIFNKVKYNINILAINYRDKSITMSIDNYNRKMFIDDYLKNDILVSQSSPMQIFYATILMKIHHDNTHFRQNYSKP